MNVFNAKKHNRYGDHFITERTTNDLSNVYFLHSGVDTIKQLYSCNLKACVYQQLETHFEKHSSDLINIDGYDFLLSKGGKNGGYQYILRNIEAGFVVMLKSFFVEADQNGSHLKIEVTPQKLYETSPEDLTKELRQLAYVFSTNVLDKGIAAHICTDFIGYEPPHDFESRLQTKSSRQVKYNTGASEFNLARVATIYGQTQTYTFGRSSALQMCFYDKTDEANSNDKLHFWESIWGNVQKGFNNDDDFLTPAYTSGDTVRRLEFRFHHGVIEDFERHIQTQGNPDATIRNYQELSEHITGLWRFALNNFRLLDSDNPGYVDPLWQSLSEDILFFHTEPHFLYKRAYKKPSSDVNHRHVAHTLGNFIKIASRRHLTPQFVVKSILNWGIESDLCSYFGLFQFGESDMLPGVLSEFVTQRMMQHRLSGVGV